MPVRWSTTVRRRQRIGASAVIAALWQIVDDSTFQLMPKFYTLTEASETRGVASCRVLRARQFKTDPSKPYAHLVLLGTVCY